jgi:hypothetical protein
MHTSILFCAAGDSKGIKNLHLSGTLPMPVLPLCFCKQSTWIPSLGPAAPLISRTWMPCLAAIRSLEIPLVSTLTLLDCSRCQVLLRPTQSRAVSPAASCRLPCNSGHVHSLHRWPPLDTGLAFACSSLLLLCLGATSSSWNPWCSLSVTGPPGAALYCGHRQQLLVSPCAHLSETPAPSEPRWTLNVVEVY